MDALKNLLNPGEVHAAAAALGRQAAGFEAERFAALATQGLEALEMKARALHICAALEATMPADFDAAAALLEAALAPLDDAEAAGLRGWICWPVGEFVARRGLQQPERALQTLHAMTQRFTAEFAIRPFLVAHPGRVFATLQRWTQDPSPAVRRLVSEGSRPRLPWGLQLKALIADPGPTLPLLRALQDDPDDAVRRSVANHLNDIAKDHPALLAAWLQQHLPGASPPRRALLRHASRTLIKQGDPAVLEAWGLGAPFHGTAALTVAPSHIALGETLALSLTLRSTAAAPQRLVVDYVVHHVKADGRTTPKVFKGWALELAPGAGVTLGKRHAVRPITTRRYHAGRHAVQVRVNGRVVAEAAFDLAMPA